MNAIQTLLAGAIDYAGLFPPAQLGMAEAARRYVEYRGGTDAWALGRFVVPATRLDELGNAVAELPVDYRADPLPLSILAGPHLAGDLAIIGSLDGSLLRPESLEVRAQSTDEIAAIATEVGTAYETYVEIPLDGDLPALIREIGRAGLRAKMRTGGVTADAFPTAGKVARFLAACVSAGIPFKATAGLHHARRGAYRLTYEPLSEEAPMYGYLNVLGATALLATGGSESDAEQLLLDESPEVLRVEENGIAWRDRFIDVDALAAMRRDGMIAFGSCSFREPLDDLAGLIAQ